MKLESKVLLFCLSGALAASMTNIAQARSCTGDTDLTGVMAFTGTRTAFTAGLTGYPGLTTSSTNYSDLYPGVTTRGVRGLISAAGLGVPFTLTGTVYADGVGGLWVYPKVQNMALTSTEITGLPNQVQVGTYAVNQDCEVNIAFNTGSLESMIYAIDNPGAKTGISSTGTGTTTGTGLVTTGVTGYTTTANFDGMLEESDNEVDLTQTDMIGGTELRLVHTITARDNCTLNSLVGNFGFVSNVGVIRTSTTAPATTNGTVLGNGTTVPTVDYYGIIGQITADGMGNFIMNPSNAISIPTHQITGTYTINPDCTGTATLYVGQSAAISTTLTTTGVVTGTTATPVLGQIGSTVTADFVVARTPAYAASTSNQYLPLIFWAFDSTGQIGGSVSKPE